MGIEEIRIKVPSNLLAQVRIRAESIGQTLDSYTSMAWVGLLLDSAPAHSALEERHLPVKVPNPLQNLSLDSIAMQKLCSAELGIDFTNTGHLWGQFHRYLPVKYTLRHLAVLSQHQKDGFVYASDWFTAVRVTANGAWESLRSMDLDFMNARGEQLASGFPKPAKEKGEPALLKAKKGLSRFCRHFCVDGKNIDAPAGMPAELGFIATRYDPQGQLMVALTPAGLEFTKLESPIFDMKPWGDALSIEEKEFLLRHTRNCMPADLDLMHDILSWIHRHQITTATGLDQKMEDEYGHGGAWAYNSAMCSTYKGGVMGRLSELKLLNRQWDNRMAVYSVSETGIAFLEEMEMKT